MTWKTGTIKLSAAQAIFSGVQFVEIKINGTTVGYSATYEGAEYSDNGLTSLCQRIWSIAQSQP